MNIKKPLFKRICSSTKSGFETTWSIIRFLGHLIGYWIAIGGGLLILYFIYRGRREHKIRLLMEKNGLQNYQKVSLVNNKECDEKDFEGLFLSRFAYKSTTEINNIGFFIIPLKKERAEIALLRYLPVLQNINCDIFVLNKLPLQRVNLKKRLEGLKRIVDAYHYFQLKTDLIDKDNLFVLTEAKSAKVALALSTQVQTKGIIIDFTRKKRSYKKCRGLLGNVKFLSLVNIVATIFEKVKTMSMEGYNPLEISPPLILVTYRDNGFKRPISFHYSLKNVKTDMLKIAIKMKEITHTEEFSETIMSLYNDSKMKKPICINN